MEKNNVCYARLSFSCSSDAFFPSISLYPELLYFILTDSTYDFDTPIPSVLPLKSVRQLPPVADALARAQVAIPKQLLSSPQMVSLLLRTKLWIPCIISYTVLMSGTGTTPIACSEIWLNYQSRWLLHMEHMVPYLCLVWVAKWLGADVQIPCPCSGFTALNPAHWFPSTLCYFCLASWHVLYLYLSLNLLLEYPT